MLYDVLLHCQAIQGACLIPTVIMYWILRRVPSVNNESIGKCRLYRSFYGKI